MFCVCVDMFLCSFRCESFPISSKMHHLENLMRFSMVSADACSDRHFDRIYQMLFLSADVRVLLSDDRLLKDRASRYA